MVTGGIMDKILVFIPYFAPGFQAGGPIRSMRNLIDCFNNDFSFSVVTLDRDLRDEERYSEVEADVWTTYKQIPVFYSSPRQLGFRKIKKIIEQEKPSLIYINSIWSISFSFKVMLLYWLGLLGKQKVVIAPRGELSKNALRFKRVLKLGFLSVFKYTKLYRNATFQATSDQEVLDINKRLGIPYSKIIKVPNIPSTMDCLPIAKQTKSSGHLDLVYISRVAKIKNLHFALECLAGLEIDVSLDMFGAIDDKDYWVHCQKIINNLPSNITVNYRGLLDADDVMKTFLRYDALLLPTSTENYGHAIVEAMLTGTLVIISENTPWRSLSDKGLGWDLPLTKEAFRDAINALNESSEYLSPENRKRRIASAEQLVGVDAAKACTLALFNKVLEA